MKLWDTIAGWFVENREHLLAVRLADPNAEAELIPGETYFGLWLTNSFLQRKRVWLKDYYPAAHVSVRLDVAGQTRTLTKLAQPSPDMVGPGVWSDFPVTGLLPYNGGTVEIEAGLSALVRTNSLGAAVSILDDFSGLVLPPVSEALTVAGKVSDGVQTLLGASEGEIFLGLHQAFVSPGGGGENVLAPGYLAVIGATEKEIDPASLLVQNGMIRVRGEGGDRPLEGFNYLLFRIEGRRERDDWKFPRFNELMSKAIDSYYANDHETYERFQADLLTAIINSPDLTRPDRNRVARAARDEIAEAISIGAGAVAASPPTLARAVMNHAVSIDDPSVATDLTLNDLLDN